MRKRFLIALFLLPAALAAYTSPGIPQGYVSDYGRMLSDATEGQIETTLNEFEGRTGVEIAVVTIPTHGTDETIETYAVKLFEAWGIGKEKEDNGLLLLVARDDREMRIEVGYGLESIITDLESSRIIREVLTPAFQANDFDGGIQAAVTRIMDDIGRGSPPPELPASPWRGIGFSPIIFYAAVVFLGSVLARSKSWWAGGIAGAVIGLLFFGTLLGLGIFAALGLLFDYVVSKKYRESKAAGVNPPWWIGGGRHGGGSGGGFGGFGGGMSGGGGSSGRW